MLIMTPMQMLSLIREERVSFRNVRGETLQGVLHYPSNGSPSAAVILCHGMESNKESEKLIALCQALARKGILALRFDFSYAGESGGQFEEITYSGEVEDLAAAFDFITRLQAGKIGVVGSSMGGTVGLLFAAKKRVDVLVTVSAPLHPEKITERLLSEEEARHWREAGFVFYHGQRINASLLDDLQRIDVPEAAKKISCPVFIIHGESDEIVPVDEAKELFELLTCPKKISVLRTADHRLSDPTLLSKALTDSIEWITHHLR
jgi:predicted alpha/beta-hydrolase family hydrolase